jgi:hypothetical protein
MDSLNSNVPAFDSNELKELKQKLVDGLGFSSTHSEKRVLSG